MQQLAINPAFFTKAIPSTSYLIHKGLRCFTSKMTSGGIDCPVALPQATIVIWFFLTEDVYLTFFWPFHTANFSGWESNEIPDSSILRIYLLWVIFQDKFTQNFFVKIIELLNIFTINCLHSDLSSELSTAKRFSFQKSPPPFIGILLLYTIPFSFATLSAIHLICLRVFPNPTFADVIRYLVFFCSLGHSYGWGTWLSSMSTWPLSQS